MSASPTSPLCEKQRQVHKKSPETCSICGKWLHFAYKLPIHCHQKPSNMANTESAERSLMLLARNCEQEMEGKIAVAASSMEKLKTLRKDSTEKRLGLTKIMGDHEKYIIMLQQAHEDAIQNVLPVAAKMAEAKYTAGSWKVEDSYGCNCSE